MHGGPPPQPLQLQAWLLASLLFAFTADICHAFRSFGRVIDQFGALSQFLHPGTTEGLEAAL